MVSANTFRKIALALPDTIEQPHFEKPAFKAGRKRIYCTLSEKDGTAVVRLSDVDQSVYCDVDPKMIYPVPNKWAKHGWTVIELKRIPVELLKEILRKAYDFAIA